MRAEPQAERREAVVVNEVRAGKPANVGSAAVRREGERSSEARYKCVNGSM